MNGTTANALCNQIVARIIAYYDIGVCDVWNIMQRVSNDLGNNNWQELFESTDSYRSGQLVEEDIIQDVLVHAGRTEFVFHGNDVDVFIGQRWESGCHDLQRIVQLTTQWLREHNNLTTVIDEAVVAGVLTRMGYIV
jgi:hypothetical protein